MTMNSKAHCHLFIFFSSGEDELGGLLSSLGFFFMCKR
jgi:hypothetical protein